MNEKECDVRFMNFEFDWQLVYLLLAFSNKFLSDRYVLTAKNVTNCYKHNYLFKNISRKESTTSPCPVTGNPQSCNVKKGKKNKVYLEAHVFALS